MRPLLKKGDLVKIKDPDTKKLSQKTYRVERMVYSRSEVRKLGVQNISTSEGFIGVIIKAKGECTIKVNRRHLWKIPTVPIKQILAQPVLPKEESCGHCVKNKDFQNPCW
jgi:hypothetical protein